MEVIKFRGQRVDTKQWVYGYYFKTPLTDEATGSKPEDGWSFLSGRERHCISQDSCVYEVIPETVGQYIGRKDMNNKEIYSDDIFRGRLENCFIEWDDEGCGFVINCSGETNETWLWEYKQEELEVIGNIIDNPELVN